MERKSFAEGLFSAATGRKVVVIQKKVFAECLRPDTKTPNGRVRPSISYDPSDPKSVARAKRVASEHVVPRGACGDNCGLPCTLRQLEDF